MLLATRSVLGIIVSTSLLAGCGSTTVVEKSGGDPPGGGATTTATGPARTLSFAKPVAYANVESYRASQMRAFDVDGDGHLDLALVMEDTAVGVMRNAGDGTFEDATWTDLGAGHMAVTDLDGDGRGDVVVTVTASEQVWALHGAADGSLGKPVLLADAPLDRESPIVTADMNGDGIPDIIVCSRQEVFRFSAPANGTHIPTSYTATNAGWQCAVGDVDANGRPDLVTGGASQTLGVWLTDSSGAMPKLDTLYPNKSDNLSATGLFAADLNGDGRADVISAFSGKLLVRIANEDGSLADPIRVSPDLAVGGLSDYGTSVSFADLDGDGHLDVVMSAGGNEGTTVAILLGDGTGNLTQANVDLGLLGDSAVDLTAGDFDGDGLVDIAVAYGSRTYVLRNTSH